MSYLAGRVFLQSGLRKYLNDLLFNNGSQNHFEFRKKKVCYKFHTDEDIYGDGVEVKPVKPGKII